MKIEFLYFRDCPHHEEAYRSLLDVLKEERIVAEIARIEIKDDVDATRHRFIGSPTIRIDGIDVEPVGEEHQYARACRVYFADGKFSGLPTKAMIEKALRVAKALHPHKG